MTNFAMSRVEPWPGRGRGRGWTGSSPQNRLESESGETVMGSIASLVRSSLELTVASPYAGEEHDPGESPHDPVNIRQLPYPSESEEVAVSSANASEVIHNTYSDDDEHDVVPLSRPYAALSDFGPCDFPPGSEEVIVDYYSGPLNEEYQIDEEFEREMGYQSVQAEDMISEDEIDDSLQSNDGAVSTAARTSQIRRNFFSADCCSYQCNTIFDRDLLEAARDEAKESNYYCPDHTNHMHISLLGQLAALTTFDSSVIKGDGKVVQRKRPSTRYMFRGQQVCQRLFQYVNNCGGKRIRNLRAQLREVGMTPKVHGRQGKMPANTASVEKIAVFKTFLLNYCDVNALVLPGRTPSFDPRDPDLRILPSSMTKVSIYKIYRSACDDPLSRRSFLRYWTTLFPNIVVQKPRTDLCSECYKMTISLGKLHGLSEDEKSERLLKSMEHLSRVKEERQLYQNATQRIPTQRALTASEPCTFKGKMHYSFDFAQQIFLPYDSQQVGPLYFLTPYKVSLFGVACEPLGKFILYVIPESVLSVGKGSNVVISLLHHFLETYGVGEEDVYCHADNCAGQNKNNYLLQYAAWRVACGLHRSFKISFLPVGHTKFAPDLYFGLVKRAYRKSCVNSLNELKKVVIASCGDHVTPFFVADEQGNMNLKIYDWQKFFQSKRASRLPGILDYYHFEATATAPGVVYYKKRNLEDYNENETFPSDVEFISSELPAEIQVTPMDPLRLKYLEQKIRPFVSDACKDILCPVYEVDERRMLAVTSAENIQDLGPVQGSSKQLFSLQTNQPATSNAASSTSSVRQRKGGQKNKCGYCHEGGHTNRLDKNKIPLCPKRRQDEVGLPQALEDETSLE